MKVILKVLKNKIVAVFNHIAEVNQRKANREIVRFLQSSGYRHLDSNFLLREIHEGRLCNYLKSI
jgi:hypothetical protein